MRPRDVVVMIAVATALAMPATAQEASGGEALYLKFCAQCHGETGDGNGHATPRVNPRPRDFTAGKYKFRSTPSGSLPTDADLYRAIREGLPYTSMPGWPQFTDGEVQQIIDHLKTFHDGFADPANAPQPIDIPAPPPMTAESIERGRAVYESQGCAACHGNVGRGNGLSAATLKDDWGYTIRAVDMTMRWTFRGGASREDIFRTFSTGVNGTPMPSYADSLEVSDRWDLVDYIVSLGDGDDPGYADLMTMTYVRDELDIDDPDALFATAPVAKFPLVGQITEPGRSFYPLASAVRVQAVYNGREVAFRVRWHDMRADSSGSNSPLLEAPLFVNEETGGDAGGGDEDFWGEEVAEEDEGDFWGEEVAEEGEDDFWGEGEEEAAADGSFSDAVALQFPSVLPSGIRKPYFLLGDSQSSVDLWFVDLARGRTQQFIGRGSEALEPSTADIFETSANYDDGEWSVIYKRDVQALGGVSFAQDQFVPIAFSLWDGFSGDRGNKRAVSQWFYVYVEPSAKESPVGPMVKTAGIVLLVELIIIFFVRRRFGERPERTGDATVAGALSRG